MIHTLLLLAYRLIVLLVLAATVRAVFAKETDRTLQITAAIVTIPLVLRLLLIK